MDNGRSHMRDKAEIIDQQVLFARLDTCFATLSEPFRQRYFDVLTHTLRVCCAICSSGSLLILFTSLTTSYWVTEKTHQGLVHTGLWEMCLGPTCHYIEFPVPEFLNVTRAFVMIAVVCGIASLLCICISFEYVSIGPIYLLAVAGLLSFSTGFFTLIAISVFTAVNKSKKVYLQHLMIFGSSYGLCWASIPAYITTAAAHFFPRHKRKLH
ncbi:lens fiber membrane intrinsic protein-like [Sphaerodactylus townsendi]|uniref:lens fiber membrane intrinsic protein-like n=1 Tax=Sphaerodactylus townsendi TaxID=933632 RepID=UPI002026063C|nr:lens fiber membrane intrinsic protein-like [Sphaerodactylus townsendi]